MELEKIRIQRNLTQKQLGDLLGVSDNTISQWETGSRQPRADMIKRLAHVLICTADELLGLERKEEK